MKTTPNFLLIICVSWLVSSPMAAAACARDEPPVQCLERAGSAIRSADLVTARAQYEALLERGDTLADFELRGARLGAARLARWDRDWNTAVRLYSKILQIDSASDEAICGLGLIALERKQLDHAQELLAQALSLNPANTEARSGLERLSSAWVYQLAVRAGRQASDATRDQQGEIELLIAPDDTNQYALKYERRGGLVNEVGTFATPSTYALQARWQRSIQGFGSIGVTADYLSAFKPVSEADRQGLKAMIAVPAGAGGLQAAYGLIWGGPKTATSALIGYERPFPNLWEGFSARLLVFAGRSDLGISSKALVLAARRTVSNSAFFEVGANTTFENTAPAKTGSFGVNIAGRWPLSKSISVGLIAERREPGIERFELSGVFTWR